MRSGCFGRIAPPGRDERGPRLVLLCRPGDRLLARKGAQGLFEAAVCKIARRLPLPTGRWRVTSVIAADPCRCFSSAKRPPRSIEASWRSSPARISLAPARFASAKSSPVTRYRASAASSTITTLSRAQRASPFLIRNSSEWTVAGAREAALASQILRDGVRRREADHLMPAALMRLADRSEREALSRAGATFDRPQARLRRCELEGSALVGAELHGSASVSAFARALTPVRGAGRDWPHPQARCRSCARTVLVVYRPTASPVLRSWSARTLLCPSTLPFTASRSATSEMCLARCRSRSRAVKVALLRVSAPGPDPDRGRPSRSRGDLLGPGVRLRVLRPHADRPNVRLATALGQVDPNIDPMLREVAVLEIAPGLAPSLAFADDGASADTPDLGLEIARLLGRNPSPSMRRVVISRCACQFARSLSMSPACGACTSS